MSVYYNEIDPFAAAWLRELMKAKQIPDGEVDTRSIELVQPADVRGFVQCHFFAGIGGWAYALRLARWDESWPVWTGSCPCQPFSLAGAQAGGDDARHLWPAWFRLIRECRPDVVFGEQVESAIGHGWLDLVCDDLESEGYAVGPVGLPAASVGAFHIRQRLWFVAESPSPRREGDMAGALRRDREGRESSAGTSGPSATCGVADTGCERRQQDASGASRDEGAHGRQSDGDHVAAGNGAARHMGDPAGEGFQGARGESCQTNRDERGRQSRLPGNAWRDCDWIPCIDGKARPVRSGTFPLATGVSHRVGQLRGAGNSIVPQVAQAFIEAYLMVVSPQVEG